MREFAFQKQTSEISGNELMSKPEIDPGDNFFKSFVGVAIATHLLQDTFPQSWFDSFCYASELGTGPCTIDWIESNSEPN